MSAVLRLPSGAGAEQPAASESPGEECTICLEKLEPTAVGNNACAQLPCGHCFHVSCALRFARSPDQNHSRCPLCRSLDPAHAAQEDSSSDEYAAPPPRESGTMLLERAMALAAAGTGSAVLRRHVRTHNKLREEKHKAMALSAQFKSENASVMRKHSALRLAKKRAMERQQNAKLAIVTHVRRAARTPSRTLANAHAHMHVPDRPELC